MPTYQYACTECDERLEAVQSFSDPALTECPVCGGRLRKVFSAVGVVFKGSGFYKNDSRSSKGSSESGSSDKGSSDKGSSDKGASEKPAAKDGGSGGGKEKAPAASSSSGGSSAPAASSTPAA